MLLGILGAARRVAGRVKRRILDPEEKRDENGILKSFRIDKSTAQSLSNRHAPLRSCVCKQAQLESAAFEQALSELQPRNADGTVVSMEAQKANLPARLHRKYWEFGYISVGLKERGMLQPGKRGLGFAVGTEPLPAYFASKGCEILATDLGSDNDSAQAWIASDQNASGNIDVLNRAHLCPDEVFRERVSYRDLDMNAIPSEVNGYDFCWSACAIEHVGGLDKSKAFLKNMLQTLKPGGIAIHTTEFNLSSNKTTIEDGYSVIYRKKDIIEIANWLKSEGHKIQLDFSVGDQAGDRFVDQPPYYQLNDQYHLRLHLFGYVSTSYGLIIEKAK